MEDNSYHFSCNRRAERRTSVYREPVAYTVAANHSPLHLHVVHGSRLETSQGGESTTCFNDHGLTVHLYVYGARRDCWLKFEWCGFQQLWWPYNFLECLCAILFLDISCDCFHRECNEKQTSFKTIKGLVLVAAHYAIAEKKLTYTKPRKTDLN